MEGDQTATVYIFDFDSTIVQVEALDELANIVLANAPDRAARIAKISEITNRGMLGEIGFGESLALRLEQIQPTKTHLKMLIDLLKANISPSFLAQKQLIQQNADSLWIVSGGFRDFILPIAAEFCIQPSHVLANEFIWDKIGNKAIDYDRSNPLAHNGGKINAVKQLDLIPAQTVMVGDGLTDYAVRGVGLVDTFIAYTETVHREPTVAVSDYVAESLDEVLGFVKW